MQLSKKYKGNEWAGCMALFRTPLTLSQVFDEKTWSKVWSTYSLYDPSYSNPESFGFFIDVGNGWTTIPPCLLLNYAMIFPQKVNPLLVGCTTLASYWQMLYGTLIYFLSYIFNKRYTGFGSTEVVLFVGLTNGIWVIFTSLGIYAAISILRKNDMSIFECTGGLS